MKTRNEEIARQLVLVWLYFVLSIGFILSLSVAVVNAKGTESHDEGFPIEDVTYQISDDLYFPEEVITDFAVTLHLISGPDTSIADKVETGLEILQTIDGEVTFSELNRITSVRFHLRGDGITKEQWEAIEPTYEDQLATEILFFQIEFLRFMNPLNSTDSFIKV